MYMDKVPQRDELEFSKMRYTAITCDPNDFVVSFYVSLRTKAELSSQDDRYTLRQKLYDPPRQTELFIVSIRKVKMLEGDTDHAGCDHVQRKSGCPGEYLPSC